MNHDSHLVTIMVNGETITVPENPKVREVLLTAGPNAGVYITEDRFHHYALYRTKDLDKRWADPDEVVDTFEGDELLAVWCGPMEDA